MLLAGCRDAHKDAANRSVAEVPQHLAQAREGLERLTRNLVPVLEGLAPALAGEPITAKLTKAPGNGADIGGLKVVAQNGWFAARPSGTEDVYKIYAESFRDETHLQRIVDEAKAIVAEAIKTV